MKIEVVVLVIVLGIMVLTYRAEMHKARGEAKACLTEKNEMMRQSLEDSQ